MADWLIDSSWAWQLYVFKLIHLNRLKHVANIVSTFQSVFQVRIFQYWMESKWILNISGYFFTDCLKMRLKRSQFQKIDFTRVGYLHIATKHFLFCPMATNFHQIKSIIFFLFNLWCKWHLKHFWNKMSDSSVLWTCLFYFIVLLSLN